MRVIRSFISLILCASFSHGATTGPKPCLTPGQTVLGVNTWTNQSFVTADDTAVSSANTDSYYIHCTGFDFSVISNAEVITGITVVISKRGSGIVNPVDKSVRLRQADGTFGGDDKKDITNWPSSLTNYTYGSSTDTWSLSLTGADVKDADFGVGIACESGSGGAACHINYMSMEIEYTPNSGRVIVVE